MSSHYFSDRQDVPSERRRISVDLPDVTFTMETDTGVFSHGRLDAGTKILLSEAPALPESGEFLDLGCGAGAIALAMAIRRPRSRVWAVDVNERARELTADNARALSLANLSTTAPDGIPDDLRFDVIWSNPPIKVGKDALQSMLIRWLGRLRQDGTAVLVVNKNLGSDSLQKWLRGQGFSVERIASRQGYRVLTVTPTHSA
jgi:16S rRNA (guanine1207-N2)-methyltransferase